MDKLDNVIAAIECCLDLENGCEGCPYNETGRICGGVRLLGDALEILRQVREERGDA